jgi:PAS domain S-box-containing protein
MKLGASCLAQTLTVEFNTAGIVHETIENGVGNKRIRGEMEFEQNSSSEVDGIPGFVTVLTPGGEIQSANPQVLQYCGCSLEVLKNWAANGTVHPEDISVITPQFTTSISAGEPYDYECRIRRFDGIYRWFHARGLPYREGGRIVRWYVLLTDIDDRKHAEQSLAKSEGDLRLFVDTIPAGAALMSAGGEVELVNKQLCSYFGKTFEELRNWQMTDALHPEDFPQVAEAMRHSLSTGEPYESEERHRRFDGVYRWFRVRALPIRGDNDVILRWNILHVDIDDQKRADEELRRSEAFLAQGEAVSETGSFLWNLETGEFRWSEQLYRIFEWEAASSVTVGRIMRQVHPEDVPDMEEMAQRARAGLDSEFVQRLLMPDRSVKYLHIVARSTSDWDGRPAYLGAIQDVTERRLAEEALNKVRSELAHASRAMSLGVLTASIAHEVNQPLAGIVTNASTCLRMLADDSPNLDGARTTAQRTLRDARRAADVLQRLRLMFARKESVTELVDLNEAAREVIALSSSEFRDRGIVVEMDFAVDLPPVIGDRVQLQQVILNLVLNAADAMTEMSDRPRNLLIATIREDGLEVRLSVCDSGPGIDPGTAGKLFQAFYTTKSKGMGVGLSISRSIIESYGGRIWGAPNSGPGATFSFTVPCAI